MISIVIPANNEAAHLGACLSALLDSTGPDEAQIVIAANGCTDGTVNIAKGFAGQVSARGWRLDVLDLPEPGKVGALNAADAATVHPITAYLDADVLVDRDLFAQLNKALAVEVPCYASGQLRLAQSESWATRAYARIYGRVPFVTDGVPGAGLYAVNAAGRARWGAFPQVIADDTFVRLNFTPKERVGVAAGYDWPLVEGFANLVRVRRRQNAGVAQIEALYPELIENDDKRSLGLAGIAKLALMDPLGFAVYAGVSLIVKLSPQKNSGWERGR